MHPWPAPKACYNGERPDPRTPVWPYRSNREDLVKNGTTPSSLHTHTLSLSLSLSFSLSLSLSLSLSPPPPLSLSLPHLPYTHTHTLSLPPPPLSLPLSLALPAPSSLHTHTLSPPPPLSLPLSLALPAPSSLHTHTHSLSLSPPPLSPPAPSSLHTHTLSLPPPPPSLPPSPSLSPPHLPYTHTHSLSPPPPLSPPLPQTLQVPASSPPSSQHAQPLPHITHTQEDQQSRAAWASAVFLHPQDQAQALLAAFYENTVDFYLMSEGEGQCASCGMHYWCRVRHHCIECPYIWHNVPEGLGNILTLARASLRHEVICHRVWGGLHFSMNGEHIVLQWLLARHAHTHIPLLRKRNFCLWPLHHASVPSQEVVQGLHRMCKRHARHFVMGVMHIVGRDMWYTKHPQLHSAPATAYWALSQSAQEALFLAQDHRQGVAAGGASHTPPPPLVAVARPQLSPSPSRTSLGAGSVQACQRGTRVMECRVPRREYNRVQRGGSHGAARHEGNSPTWRTDSG